jgi:CBS domain-containing protein
MYDLRIRDVVDRKSVLIATPAASVSKVAKQMAQRKISAVLVVDGGRLTGIFTERDAVHRVIAQKRSADATRLSEVMTPDPTTVTPDETFGYAMLLMHRHGFRHIPVIENGKPIGIVSARNALDPELEEFTFEEARRKRIRRYPPA